MNTLSKETKSIATIHYGKVVVESYPNELRLDADKAAQLQIEKSRNAFLRMLEPPKDKKLRRKWFLRRILLLTLFVILSIVAILLGVDKPIVASVLVVVAIISQSLAGLIALLGLIPIIGPTIVWAFSLPIVWLMNALGYVVSLKLAAEGKGKDILNWRTVAIVFIVGVVIGIVIGRFIS